jgi:CheY-like chemotaxis protein
MPKTILLVDDQDLMQRVLQATLRTVGAHFASAKTGTEAVRFVGDKRPVDAIILDFSMPDQDGVETLRQIRALPNGRDIPILMLTARDQTLIREAASGMGVRAFMTKPFSPAMLQQTVREMLAEEPHAPGKDGA